jgi:hypothetical protein
MEYFDALTLANGVQVVVKLRLPSLLPDQATRDQASKLAIDTVHELAEKAAALKT